MKLITFSSAKKTKNETKPMRYSQTASKKKRDKVTLDIFPNLTYVSSYLHLKSTSWKRDCTISLKVKMLRS